MLLILLIVPVLLVFGGSGYSRRGRRGWMPPRVREALPVLTDV
jgi:hypothetical protein